MRLRVLVAVLAASFAVVPGVAVAGPSEPAASPHLTWHTATIDPMRGRLVDLDCPATHFCAAVEHRAGLSARLITFGTGKSVIKATQDAVTSTVACTSATFCVAGPADRAYTWDGQHWQGPVDLGAGSAGPTCAHGTDTCAYWSADSTLIHDADGWRSVPLPPDVHARAVSCVSATFCEVLGDFVSAHFDGSAWIQDEGAARTTGAHTQLSCATPSFCHALSANDHAIFDGTAWHDSNVGLSHFDTDLTCVAADDCLAVNRASGDIVERQFGHKLKYYALGRSFSLLALSCTSATLCRASDASGSVYTLADHKWTSADHVVPSAGQLTDVSCASRTWCMAVDAHGNALRWAHGHWSAPRSIDVAAPLVAVSCSPQRVCVAIDALYGPDRHGIHRGARAVFYHDGKWHHPVFVAANASLSDVACPTSRCYVSDRHGHVYARTSGGEWSGPRKVAHSLTSIDCAGSQRCVAVGLENYGRSDDGVRAVQYDGKQWTPLADTPRRSFFSVDCVDAEFCLALGEHGGFFLRHGGWHGPVVSGGEGSVGCASRKLCLVDLGEDTFRVAPGHSPVLVRHRGNVVACAPGPLCVQIRGAKASVGRG